MNMMLLILAAWGAVSLPLGVVIGKIIKRGGR